MTELTADDRHDLRTLAEHADIVEQVIADASGPQHPPSTLQLVHRPIPGGPNIDDLRFTRGLYSVADAARLVGMSASTFATWAHGYERSLDSGRRVVKARPVISTVKGGEGRQIPFVGLVEATVVQAFRQTGLPLQRIRRALEVLEEQGELHHALASKKLYSDGANVLYDYATEQDDKQLRMLTLVSSGQVVFHEVIEDYLKRISFERDGWATSLIVPATGRRLLQIRPEVAGGEPLFITGGGPLSAVRSRAQAGESLGSIARDYGLPESDVREALSAIWPQSHAA